MTEEPTWMYKGRLALAPVKIALDGPDEPVLGARAPKFLMPLAERWLDFNEKVLELTAELIDIFKPGYYETCTKKLVILCRIDGTPLQPGDYGYEHWR